MEDLAAYSHRRWKPKAGNSHLALWTETAPCNSSAGLEWEAPKEDQNPPFHMGVGRGKKEGPGRVTQEAAKEFWIKVRWRERLGKKKGSICEGMSAPRETEPWAPDGWWNEEVSEANSSTYLSETSFLMFWTHFRLLLPLPRKCPGHSGSRMW